MSDIEEPPAKILKTEMSSNKAEESEMAEGQEEWLSEELLTDDDHPNADPDKTDSNLDTSQEELDETFLDEALLSADHSMDSHNASQGTSQGNVRQESEASQETKKDKPETESIEQTLNNLENQSQDSAAEQAESQITEKSDGNDTDDLLRLLGDNDEKTKKKVLVKTKDKKKNGVSRVLAEMERAAVNDDETGSSDDEYIYNSTTIQKLRVAKNAIVRKPASRAEPEDLSDGDDETDCSSNEAVTMKNIFTVNKKRNNVASKSTSKPPYPRQSQAKQAVNKIESRVQQKQPPTKTQVTSKAPLKIIGRNTTVKTVRAPSAPVKVNRRVKEESAHANELDEIINENEFMEEDGIDLNDDFAVNSDEGVAIKRNKQQIMKPEEMDEEVPTDAESSDGDISMYDELPSSESEDMNDMFTLDIRAERASDYLPLLGNKAYDLLNGEKRRVAEHLKTLRNSVSQLSCSGQRQADQLRRAAVTLSELDDMLKAA
ncbi:DNA ligase 1 [Amyelois transitella]|uniref:DNA ligase 1 n=1 Tax=Amyelois transitella TaxID=680683 RepID=UPI00067B9A59|nr:DNA ligase 1 [Amyelois transitella]XP_060809104.1 DNA ligase 1 [Amyelois transitella]